MLERFRFFQEMVGKCDLISGRAREDEKKHSRAFRSAKGSLFTRFFYEIGRDFRTSFSDNECRVIKSERISLDHLQFWRKEVFELLHGMSVPEEDHNFLSLI